MSESGDGACAKAPEEMVAWVDENNIELAPMPRSRVRGEGLRHRSSYIFVFHSNGKVLLQRRSQAKDLYAGWYDACAGGVLRPGEAYADNAARELAEELGVRGCRLERRDAFYFEHEKLRVFGESFVAMHDGPFAFTDDEVDWAGFVPVAGVMSGHFTPVTPDSVFALERLSLTGL